MAITKYPQVWKDGKWYAMFFTLKDAKAWVAKQAGTFEVNDKRPDLKKNPTTVQNSVDTALDKALAATRPKEATDASPPTG